MMKKKNIVTLLCREETTRPRSLADSYFRGDSLFMLSSRTWFRDPVVYKGMPNGIWIPGCRCASPRMTTQKAFTLIELLVVVLIIGILAAAALPQYQKAVYKSKAIEVRSVLTQIVNAQKVYYLSNGVFAEDLADLVLTFPVVNKKVNIKNNIWCSSVLPQAKVDQRIVCISEKPALSLQQYLNHNRFLCCAYAKDNYSTQTFCQQYTRSTNGKSLCGDQNPCLCYE